MFSNLDDSTVIINPDKVSEICFNQYIKLSRNGKPTSCEWTVLSCILLYDKVYNTLEIMSMGTGTKCIGESAMCPMGYILNDSHAEVMARRGFLLYLYDHIDAILNNLASILTKCEDGKFKLKDEYDLVFYSTHVPCGDATIAPSNNDSAADKDTPLKHKIEDKIEENIVIPSKKLKLDKDLHRTGAKCLPNSDVQDPKGPGVNYHVFGQVRTKPGRGVRTLSVSCTDKVAKWMHLGIQGSLITLLCKPFYIKHFVFGTGNTYCEESLKRAFLNRNGSIIEPPVKPVFYQSKLEFEYLKTETRHRPSPNGTFWVAIFTRQTVGVSGAVSAHGKKLGFTKNLKSNKMAVAISKYNIYKTFIELLNRHNDVKIKLLNDLDPKSIPYNEMKKKATEYYENWKSVKEKFFKSWTVKPDMWDFRVEEG